MTNTFLSLDIFKLEGVRRPARLDPEKNGPSTAMTLSNEQGPDPLSADQDTPAQDRAQLAAGGPFSAAGTFLPIWWPPPRVEQFLKVSKGTKEENRENLPPMQGMKIMVDGSGRGVVSGSGWEESADNVLSSCGWIMMSFKEGATFTFMAFTMHHWALFLPSFINEG